MEGPILKVAMLIIIALILCIYIPPPFGWVGGLLALALAVAVVTGTSRNL